MQCENSTADGNCNAEQRFDAMFLTPLFCDEARDGYARTALLWQWLQYRTARWS
jgi:hypothetical protein